MVILQACETIPTIVVDTSCTAFQPITYSAPRAQTDEEFEKIIGGSDLGNLLDTSQTIHEIRQHNAAWDSLCSKE